MTQVNIIDKKQTIFIGLEDDNSHGFNDKTPKLQ
jgi:hypothetical protein